MSFHVVTFTLISNLVTDYFQKRRGEPGLFSFKYNLLPKLISNFYALYRPGRSHQVPNSATYFEEMKCSNFIIGYQIIELEF